MAPTAVLGTTISPYLFFWQALAGIAPTRAVLGGRAEWCRGRASDGRHHVDVRQSQSDEALYAAYAIEGCRLGRHVDRAARPARPHSQPSRLA
jgi:hypothetical protein